MPAASATRATLGYAGAEQRCNECPHRRGELGRVRAVEAGLRDLQGRIHGGEAIGGRPSA